MRGHGNPHADSAAPVPLPSTVEASQPPAMLHPVLPPGLSPPSPVPVAHTSIGEAHSPQCGLLITFMLTSASYRVPTRPGEAVYPVKSTVLPDFKRLHRIEQAIAPRLSRRWEFPSEHYDGTPLLIAAIVAAT